jgi:methylmalonyl-CoA mutase
VDRVLAKGKTDLGPAELASRFQRELVTELYDQFEVQPLYTATDVVLDTDPGLPGFVPFVRGADPLGSSQTGWDIRQAVDVDPSNPSATADLMLGELGRGCSSILLRSRSALDGSSSVADVLEQALKGVYLDLVTISLDASLGSGAPEALLDLWHKKGIGPAEARGVLGIDPIGAHASTGGHADLEQGMELMVRVASRCDSSYSAARAVVVDATRYHGAGGSDSEELGCAMATGVAYVRALVAAGLSIEQALNQIEFRFAATADQFLTVAKLRAARLMWTRVAQACGVDDPAAQRQHAMTSRAMITRYDPWVNLLRGTIACFAAGVGGADSVTVESYDVAIDDKEISELGRRLARNTQTILIEESHVARVVDPAGGSWYVESLTQSVAQQSWAWFQQIEQCGGMVAALDAGVVSERVEATWAKRLANLSRRKDTITGVSDFPNAEEEIPLAPAPVPVPEGGLPVRRYAEPFEALRQRVDADARRRGATASVVLVNIGTPSDYTARTTYAKSFFETAGLRTIAVESAVTDAAALALVTGDGHTVACICSSDTKYEESGAAVVQLLASAGLKRIYVAGRRSDALAGLEEAGASEFIGVGSNVLETLERLLDMTGIE